MPVKPYFFTLFLLLFTAPLPSQAQLEPWGLQGETVNSIAGEMSDYTGQGYGFVGNLMIFAGTDSSGVHEAIPFEDKPNWRPLGLRDKPISALCVQHWGVGPRDGIHLFAAMRDTKKQNKGPLIFRREFPAWQADDSTWVACDSGISYKEDTSYIKAMDAYYFTGHTPGQPVIAIYGDELYTGTSGGTFWTKTGSIGEDGAALDVNPHWFGTRAWAVGGWVNPKAVWSDDKGATWSEVNLQGSVIEDRARCVLINPRFPDSVAVGQNALFLTPDNGSNWSSLYNGVAQALAADPQFPECMFAGFDGDFLVTTDGGARWRKIDPPAGKTLGTITSLLFVDADSVYPRTERNYYVFVGTRNTGVWRYKPEIPTGSERPPDAAQDEFYLNSFPNPMISDATVVFSVPGPRRTTVRIYDMLGRVVETLYEGISASQTQTRIFHRGALPEGMYICRLESEGGRSLNRMMVAERLRKY
jgi:hypothetical protein